MDPDVVSRWSMPDFTDRQEFMMITTALSDPAYKEETEWTGRNG